MIEIVLTHPTTSAQATRSLLGDTGAGSRRSAFAIVLKDSDCLQYGGTLMGFAQLSGAYLGLYPIYGVRVQVPQLAFDDDIEAIGVRTVPAGFEGIACFRFLNRFTFGNFADSDRFGIEL